ncbi:MAG: adenosylcobinamide-phosphate synthase CbiB [Alphaproteobacteria bacterium]
MFAHFPGGLGRPDTILLVVMALGLDWVVGDMPVLFRFVPHPVQLMGGLVGWIERRLNRERRAPATRRIRGLIVVVLLCAVAAVAGFEIARVSRSVPYGFVIELFFVTALVAQRSLFDHVYAVAKALRGDGLAAGKDAVRHIVGRDLDQLDEHGVARAAIESCAENFSDGVVAPVFWYVVLGLPGLMVYKTANTMDSMIGHRSARYRDFGMAAARLDDLLNLIPARLAGLILAIAALFTPTANPIRALATMFRDAGKHSSPNAGWPEAATAGALDLALAGPRRYGEVLADDPWIGRGRARANHQDIHRTLFLYVVACAVNAALLGLVAAGQILLYRGFI